jgi:hypothetical protein
MTMNTEQSVTRISITLDDPRQAQVQVANSDVPLGVTKTNFPSRELRCGISFTSFAAVNHFRASKQPLISFRVIKMLLISIW